MPEKQYNGPPWWALLIAGFIIAASLQGSIWSVQQDIKAMRQEIERLRQ